MCLALAGTAAVPVLWWMGLVGGGKYDEHVVDWEIAITAQDNGVLVVETITMDFGNESRSGVDRTIDHGLGVPEKVFGYPSQLADPQPPSGDAPMVWYTFSEQQLERADASTIARLQTEFGGSTGVQQLVGLYLLPDKPEIGEHFEFELIDAGRSVDASKVYVSLDGMTLDALTCRRSSGTACALEEVDGYAVVQLSSLPADDSLTVGGTVTGWKEPVDHLRPGAVDTGSGDRDEEGSWLPWILPVPAAAAGFAWSRRMWQRRSAARWLATTPALVAVDGGPAPELVPLPSDSPWQGRALLHHQVGRSTVVAWFAEQVAAGVLTVRTADEAAVFRRGPNFEHADLGVHDELARMFDHHDEVRMDLSQVSTQRVATLVRRWQASTLRKLSWWRRFGPGGRYWFSPQVAGVLVAWAAVLAALIATDWSRSWPVAIGLLLLVPLSVNAAIAWWMAPQLSTEGADAVAAMAPLRRMLRLADASHVEAADRAGLLPQYSAWAVAFGAADRWRDAVCAADLPADAAAAALAPLDMGRTSGSGILTSA